MLVSRKHWTARRQQNLFSRVCVKIRFPACCRADYSITPRGPLNVTYCPLNLPLFAKGCYPDVTPPATTAPPHLVMFCRSSQPKLRLGGWIYGGGKSILKAVQIWCPRNVVLVSLRWLSSRGRSCRLYLCRCLGIL